MKPPPISKYARNETRTCLRHFKTNLRQAAKHSDDPDAIHDLRVSIRRLTQCFRIFRDLLDPAPVKKLRRRLHKIMEYCGDVRNRDIALELLEECGLTESPSVPKLKTARAEAARKLHRSLKKERRRHHRALSSAARPPHPPGRSPPACPHSPRTFFKPAAQRWPPVPATRLFTASASARSASATPWNDSSPSTGVKWQAVRRHSKVYKTTWEPLTIASLPSTFSVTTRVP